ncbi:DUF1266 domain-containing protein [Paenibacillus tuaregi]|uniref:DUF1266 domain-containing protein n=1 Tax=Paenibacillus tuaregi TaxID=1816681 RepID=UPI000838DE05|nr:DUF1266 domain-containing protein [Paenibacillus tuaregi]
MIHQLSIGQKWALAIGETLLSLNGYSFNNNYYFIMDEEETASAADRLYDYWDINDKESAWSTLNILYEGGHNTRFFNLHRDRLSIMSPDKQEQYISTFTEQESKNELLIIQRYYDCLPRSGIHAWDLGRASYVCYTCLQLNYIEHDKAWSYLMKNAELAQQSYASWQEFGTAYMVGRQLWAGELDQERTEEHQWLIRNQFSDPNGPWLILPWDTDLRN